MTDGATIIKLITEMLSSSYIELVYQENVLINTEQTGYPVISYYAKVQYFEDIEQKIKNILKEAYPEDFNEDVYLGSIYQS